MFYVVKPHHPVGWTIVDMFKGDYYNIECQKTLDRYRTLIPTVNWCCVDGHMGARKGFY